MPTLNIEIDNNKNLIAREIDQFPKNCPLCHYGIVPIYKFGHLTQNLLQCIFLCPNCYNLFIAYYNLVSGHLFFRKSLPTHSEPRIFSQEIKEISPSFMEIFNQSLSAESFDLIQVCGPGYRKALEFLIKDYAVLKNPDKKNQIEDSLLAKVISEHVTDENIKSTAKLATWLGNDETHYVRKWTEMDLSDLKILIELTVRWVEMEAMTKKYKERMNA